MVLLQLIGVFNSMESDPAMHMHAFMVYTLLVWPATTIPRMRRGVSRRVRGTVVAGQTNTLYAVYTYSSSTCMRAYPFLDLEKHAWKHAHRNNHIIDRNVKHILILEH